MSDNFKTIPVLRKGMFLDVLLYVIFGAAFGLIFSLVIGTIWGILKIDTTHFKLAMFSPIVLGGIIGAAKAYTKEKRRSKNPFLYDVCEVLEEGIKGFKTPDAFEAPRYVFRQICRAYVKTGKIFSGSIKQFIELGIENDKEEHYIRLGFAALEREGFLSTHGDIFVSKVLLTENLF